MTPFNSALVTRLPLWCCLYLAALRLFHPACAFQLQDGMAPFHTPAQATLLTVFTHRTAAVVWLNDLYDLQLIP